MFLTKRSNLVYWLGNNLYLNVTNKCSNNCYFCLRRISSGVGGFNLRLTKEPSIREVISELENAVNRKNWSEIVFCGFGEPLERLDCVLKITRWIRRYYGKPITIRIDTNGHGFLLNKRRKIAEELKDAGVDKISVSLNAHNRTNYNRVCRPYFENAFASVVEFVERTREDFDVEVTAVAIPEIDISKVKEIAVKMGVKFRAREYIQGFW